MNRSVTDLDNINAVSSVYIEDPNCYQPTLDDEKTDESQADESAETHECTSCGTRTKLDTPYTTTDSWCESCEAVQTHTSIE